MLHGYAGRNRPAGIRPEDRPSEPLCAGALALEGAGGRIVVVTLDMIGVHAAEIDSLRAAVKAGTDVGAGELLIAASHTHFAPCISPQLFHDPALGVVDPDPRFVARVTESVVEAVRESLTNMETGTMETCRVPVPSVVFNRRTIRRETGSARIVQTSFLYPELPGQFEFSPVDPELAAIRIVTAAGPRAVLLNFGCHPVTGGNDPERDFYRISADYPFHLRRAIEDSWGCPAFFTLGAAGDAVPMNRAGSSRREIGGALGSAVLLGERVFAASGRRAEGEVRIASRVVELAVKTNMPTRGTDAGRTYRALREKALASPAGSDGESAGEFVNAARRAYRARLYPEDRFTAQVQLVRIGETVLVCMPFEVLSEFSLRLKRAFPHAVVVSIANGYEGYLPFAYEFERGGYEVTPDTTHFETDTADRLLEKVLAELSAF